MKFYRSICSLFFFFSSRRRHTRYWRDWSSDVCSSDLEEQTRRDAQTKQDRRRPQDRSHLEDVPEVRVVPEEHPESDQRPQIGRASCRGKSVDLGGRRIIKKIKRINEE